MRIFSKFRDYYDHIGVYSSTPVWERKTREIGLVLTKKTDEISLTQNRFLNEVYSDMPKPRVHDRAVVNRYVLGFCGKFYPIYQIAKMGYMFDGEDDFIKSFDKASEFLKVYAQKFGSVPDQLHRFYRKHEFTDELIQEWLDKYNAKLTVDLFITVKSPIFLLTGSKLIVNPRLLDYNFERIMDIVTAHQEIEMYLNNDLVDNFEPMPNFGDDLKRDSKGMDKWSFRQKGPKKRKRKEVSR